MNDLKPGFKTSEFWISLVMLVASIIVLILNALGKQDLATTIASGLTGLGSVLGFTIPRAQVKRTSMKVKTIAAVSEVKTENP